MFDSKQEGTLAGTHAGKPGLPRGRSRLPAPDGPRVAARAAAARRGRRDRGQGVPGRHGGRHRAPGEGVPRGVLPALPRQGRLLPRRDPAGAGSSCSAVSSRRRARCRTTPRTRRCCAPGAARSCASWPTSRPSPGSSTSTCPRPARRAVERLQDAGRPVRRDQRDVAPAGAGPPPRLARRSRRGVPGPGRRDRRAGPVLGQRRQDRGAAGTGRHPRRPAPGGPGGPPWPTPATLLEA